MEEPDDSRHKQAGIPPDNYCSLTQNEQSIIALIRSGKITSLSVSMDQDARPSLLSWTSLRWVKEDEMKSVMSHLKFKDYKQVVIKTNGNKTVYLEETIRKKLPPSGNSQNGD